MTVQVKRDQPSWENELQLSQSVPGQRSNNRRHAKRAAKRGTQVGITNA